MGRTKTTIEFGWRQSQLKKTQRLLAGNNVFGTFPRGHFWGVKRLLNSVPWTILFPSPETLECSTEKRWLPGGKMARHTFRQSCLCRPRWWHWFVFPSVIHWACVKFSWKEVDSCPAIISGSGGKAKDLEKIGQALNLEASFSYIELFR